MNPDVEYKKQYLSSLGIFYPLRIAFDLKRTNEQLFELKDSWKPYNPSKPTFGRYGLSLFSLDGETSGEIDLDSLYEYNLRNNTTYDELSFATPTPFWNSLKSISMPLKEIEPYLGRSHFIKFDFGGFFPPHRDLGESFRLIAFFNCSPISLNFQIDDRKMYFDPGQLYYADTRITHSVFSFQKDAFILVLNVKACDESIRFVYQNLLCT